MEAGEMKKVWRVCFSGVSTEGPRAYRQNLKWLVAAETAESAAQCVVKRATGEHKMVQATIWSIEFVGEMLH